MAAKWLGSNTTRLYSLNIILRVESILGERHYLEINMQNLEEEKKVSFSDQMHYSNEFSWTHIRVCYAVTAPDFNPWCLISSLQKAYSLKMFLIKSNLSQVLVIFHTQRK